MRSELLYSPMLPGETPPRMKAYNLTNRHFPFLKSHFPAKDNGSAV